MKRNQTKSQVLARIWKTGALLHPLGKTGQRLSKDWKWCSNWTPGCVSKVISNRWLHGHNYSSKFRTGNRWKRPQCPLTGEGTNRMWCTHTLECYTTLRKRNPVRCFSVDGPWGLWWEKWDSHKKTVLHDSSYASWLSRVLRWIEKQSRTVSAKGGKG